LRSDDVTDCLSIESDALSFMSVLKILSKSRLQCEVHLQEVFLHHDTNSSGGLTLAECKTALHACHIRPKTQAEAAELTALVEEFDEDGSGEVDAEEFLRLASFINNHLQKSRREAERQAALACGYEEEFDDLRAVFIANDECISESLSAEALRSAVLCLRSKTWTAEEIDGILKDHEVEQVDFVGFLSVIKIFDEKQRHYELCRRFGIEKDGANQLCAIWRELQPEGGKISRERMVGWLSDVAPDKAASNRAVGINAQQLEMVDRVLSESNDNITFVEFLRIMRLSIAEL